jgi:hypothetical protein
VENAGLPATNAADVYVDEIGGGVVADSAAVEGESGVAEFSGGDAGNANVDGHGLHVQAVLGDAVAVGSEILVAPRRAVAADDVDFGIGTVEGDEDVVKEVEDAGVVDVNVAGAVIAKEFVEDIEGGGIVGVAVLEDDVEALAGMGVKEAEAVGSVGGGAVFGLRERVSQE